MTILRTGRKYLGGSEPVPRSAPHSHPRPLRITTDENGTETVEVMPQASSDTPPRPYEDYRTQFLGHVYTAVDSLRIRWPVFGDLGEILVADDVTDPLSLTRPFRLPDGRLHPVADAQASDPPVSEIRVGIQCLDDLSSATLEECDCERIETADRTVDVDCRCRIYYRSPELARVTADREGAAVTIGNLIRTLHPYINSLKGDILRAHSIHDPCNPLPPDTQFFALDVFPGPSLELIQDHGPEDNQLLWERNARMAKYLSNTPLSARR